MNVWEPILFVLAVVLAIVPFLGRSRRPRVRLGRLAFAVVVVSAASAFIVRPQTVELLDPFLYTQTKKRVDSPEQYLPQPLKNSEYVTSSTCKDCHPGQHGSWHASYHRSMTQLPSPDVVLAPFENITLESRNRKYHLERRGDEYWVTMPDPDWEAKRQNAGIILSQISNPPMVTRKIVMTTGSHKMQGYWVATPGLGLLRQIPWYYHIPEKKWIPREDAFILPPNDYRHFMVWNDVCIRCHSVAGNPGYASADIPGQTKSGGPRTQVAELGIACEACHGPGEQHARFYRNPINRYGYHLTGVADTHIVDPKRLSPEKASQICAQCHSQSAPTNGDDFWTKGVEFRPGGDFHKAYQLATVGSDADADMQKAHRSAYWRDGSCLPGGSEYMGLIESPCYKQGSLSCISCHSMHQSNPSNQLGAGMNGDRACLQCHTQFEKKIEQHTHHKADSEGSRCYNCHMPFTSYALLTAMRSHRIDSPNIASSAQTGRPNACNLCHLDKTLAWSAETMTKWYGTPEVKLTDDQKKISAAVLWLLQGSSAQRVVTVWNMGWPAARQATGGSQWIAPFVAQLLVDPYSGVRYVAQRTLRQLPGFSGFEYDYVGPDEQRAQAKQRAIEQWEKQPNRTGKADPVSVLLDADGKIRHNELERLLKGRDDTPTSIPQ